MGVNCNLDVRVRPAGATSASETGVKGSASRADP